MTNAAQLENFFNIETKIGIWRKGTLDYLQSIYPLGASSEEIALALKEDEGNIQPRTRELSRCDRDYIRGLGRGVNSKQNPVTIWYYNPTPDPKPFIPAGHGDKKLYKLMAEASIEWAKNGRAHDTKKMEDLAAQWVRTLGKEILQGNIR